MLLKWTAATATCHKKSGTVGAAVQHPYVAEKPTTCACASLLVYVIVLIPPDEKKMWQN